MEKRSFQNEEFEHQYSRANFWKKVGVFALALGLAIFTVVVINL